MIAIFAQPDLQQVGLTGGGKCQTDFVWHDVICHTVKQNARCAKGLRQFRKGEFLGDFTDDYNTIVGSWEWTENGRAIGYDATVTRVRS